MTEKVIDWFPRLTSIVSLLVSVVGLGSIVISYRALRQADENLRITGYQQMVSQSVDIDKAIVEHPSMRPYFRDKNTYLREIKIMISRQELPNSE